MGATYKNATEDELKDFSAVGAVILHAKEDGVGLGIASNPESLEVAIALTRRNDAVAMLVLPSLEVVKKLLELTIIDVEKQILIRDENAS